MSALDERRQAAREAYYDATNLPEKFSEDGLADAIETATRVRLTPEILIAAHNHVPAVPPSRMRAVLTAAFTAAGFEVLER